MTDALLNSNMASDDLFIQKRVEIMIDMSTKKMAGEISNLRLMVDKLNSEIGSLKQHLSNNHNNANHHSVNDSASIAPPPRPNREIKDYEEPVVVQRVPQAIIKDQPKPRYGDYKSEDVSIDKFFYFGNKK